MAKLLFTMELPNEPRNHLVLGNLCLDYEDGSDPINYLVTSGAPGRQLKELFWKAGKAGPIPPGKYYIPTIPYKLATPGIDGPFFHIQPDPVSSAGRRSELGIHLDSNYKRSPGTYGCVGFINASGFDRFCERLLALHSKGIKKIDLEVRYI